MNDNLIPAEGTILNMSPAVGVVQFTFPTLPDEPDDVLTFPLVGYAVVVTHSGPSEYYSDVYPVILHLGRPVDVYWLTSDDGEYPQAAWQVIPE